jgi:hypothetical protein
MQQVFAFGLNFGNVGRVTRPPMDELVGGWNSHWKGVNCEARVVRWYGHTGNFVLELDHGGLPEAIRVLHVVEPSRRFAVFEVDTFESWLALVRIAAKQIPAKEPHLRWTPGIVMDSDLDGSTPVAPNRPGGVRFGPEARPRLMMVWKPDRLLPGRDKLDPNPKTRAGGWGSVARVIGPKRWTARSLRTVEGLCAEWREGISRSHQVDASSADSTLPRATREGEDVPDPHYALIAARREAERLARELCARARVDVAAKRFVEVCAAIEQARLLNPKGTGLSACAAPSRQSGRPSRKRREFLPQRSRPRASTTAQPH